MTKPKIEDFIPPGWYAAMDPDGWILFSQQKPKIGKHDCQWYGTGSGHKISPLITEHMDLSIFGDDWEKSLFQKPPELPKCPACGGDVAVFETHSTASIHKRVKCVNDCLSAKLEIWPTLTARNGTA